MSGNEPLRMDGKDPPTLAGKLRCLRSLLHQIGAATASEAVGEALELIGSYPAARIDESAIREVIDWIEKNDPHWSHFRQLKAALSAQPAPSSKDAGFVQQIELLDREIDSLRGVIATYEAAASGSEGVWFYQGDGFDFPESMACPVVMRADQFRELMATRSATGRQGDVIDRKYDNVLVPFAHLMARELHANAGKGDRPGWLSMTPAIGMLEIYHHAAKLQKAVKIEDAAGTREYAADVANMAMMLLDVCGGLSVLPDNHHGRPADVPEPLAMGAAPHDGTMLRLLVRFTEHATDDAEEAWTIGSNSCDANGEDVWQFAGWCWTHDHFTEGKGTPIGWLPMLAATPSAPTVEQLALREDA